jgi:tellurite resistance protein TehA-like permease
MHSSPCLDTGHTAKGFRKKEKLKNIIRREAERFEPGYFAFVMATGIVSIAAFMWNMEWIAWSLFQLNKIAYIVLIVLTLSRLFLFLPFFIRDVTGFVQGPSLFTLVAGTCILGGQFVILSRNFTAGFLLWVVGIVLWSILIYAFFTKILIQESKPSPSESLDGGWLIYAVGTQSASVLGTLLASRFPGMQESLLLFSLVMYLLGCMLYFILAVLIVYRLLFLALPPEKLTPLYWINMGAGAIITLSGATLILNSGLWMFLENILPFLRGLTLFFWAITTWWIPLLVSLNIWRYVCKRLPIIYDVQYWSMVFPLAMYAVCTFQLANAMGVKALLAISVVFLYVALAVWTMTFMGFLGRLLKFLRNQHRH